MKTPISAELAYSCIRTWLVDNVDSCRSQLTNSQLSLIEALPDSDSAFRGDMLAVFREVLTGKLDFSSECSDGIQTLGEYARAGSGDITGMAGHIDFTDEEADQLFQGPLANHINGVEPSFLFRPMRINGGADDGKYAILDGSGNLVDSVNRDKNKIKKMVSDLWLDHYQQHKNDWWKGSPDGCPIRGNSYLRIMLSVFEMNGIDWRSELSPEELHEADKALRDVR